MDEITNIICRANGRDKVIDFRDQLVIATKEHYATIHQQPGKTARQHGKFPSSIGVTICDYSNGTGEKSLTLSANIKPYLIDEWLTVCKANCGTRVIAMGEAHGTGDIAEITNTLHLLQCRSDMSKAMAEMNLNLVGEAIELVKQAVNHGKSLELLKSIGNALWQTRKTAAAKYNAALQEEREEKLRKSVAFRNLTDYNYTQTRVNSYKKTGPGGSLCPVTMLTVKRQSLNEKNETWGYPWYIQIISFDAKPVTHANGTITYDQRSIQNKKECFIKLSDETMFEMMKSCQDTIEVFKMATVSNYMEGKRAYEAQMIERSRI